MLEFLKANRKSYPKYFRMKELKKYLENGQLHEITRYKKVVGFYVLEDEKFKSLYINKNYRQYSRNLIKKMFKNLKQKCELLTIAVNNRSKKVRNLAIRNGFKPTNKIVNGKTHLLEVYEWKAN